MGVRIHVGLLHHVFRFRVIPENGARRSIDALVMTAHQYFEQCRMSIEHAGDNLFVGELAPSLEQRRIHDMHRASSPIV